MKILLLFVLALPLIACSFDASGPNPEDVNLCGNNEINGTEDCDGNDLDGETCESLGFDSGTLSCNTNCSFDTSQCEGGPSCGNGIIDGFEICDGTSLNGATCESQGYESGTLTCNADCGSYNTSQCEGTDPCGNGVIDGSEACDNTNLNGETCFSLGFASGILACNTDCTFDTSECAGDPCGNGVLDTNEECDDNLLGGETCESQGFGGGGDLACTNNCTFDTTGCIESECGNGIVEGDEFCDDGYTDPCGSCNANCTGAGTGFTCGDGIVCPEFEECDDNYTDSCGSCNADCSGPGVGSCGDGAWCPETEECDDGVSGPDGCNDSCEIVDPYICVNAPGEVSVCTISTCPGTPISAGITNGNTSLGVNDINQYGTEPGPAREKAYTITVPNNNFIKVRLFNLDSGFDGVIAIMDGCPGNVLVYEDTFWGGGQEKAVWFNRTGGPATVTVVVDGYEANDEGPFSIEVIVGNASAPGAGSLLVFNEYIAYVSTAVDEWVEFYHAGTTHLNLNGCRFKTDTINETINEDILVSPGDYFVFKNSSSNAVGSDDNVVWGWTAAGGVIHGQTDTLFLYAPNNTVIDQIGPLQTNNFPNGLNNSSALDPSHLGDKTANDSGANWNIDSSPTPGYPNN